MVHGRARFQAILGAKESIKCFMQRGESACVWGYCAGRVLWHVVDGRHGTGKWGWIFPFGRGEVAEEEGHKSQLGWQNFS